MSVSRPWAVLSPYLIPPSLVGHKICNLGDGFILRAIERQMGQRFAPQQVFTPREAPAEDAKVQLREARGVILAGANQLNDRYTVWPRLDAATTASAGYRFVPFGIGLHGEPGFNDGMSEATKAMLRYIHEQIRFSSWRCPATVAYLRRQLPQLADRFLMTVCPVVYDRPLLEGERFHEREASVAVTATERGDFWARETAIIDAAARRFPQARKYFVVHQNFSPPRRFELLRHRLMRPSLAAIPDRVERLRAYARHRGFHVVVPESADACIAFYDGIDVHVGTRLHAHLLFLSRNKRSYLVPVDERSTGIAQALGFPLPLPDTLERNWDFDFEVVRRHAREHYKTMRQFVESLPK